MTALPPEPGTLVDLEHGLTEPGIVPADQDDSTDDEAPEVNDYDAYPDDQEGDE